MQKRIKKYYQKEATVIPPPVDTKRFKSSGERKNDYFLIVSAFAPYKRVDLAVEAFNKLGYPFVVIGEGQDADSLRRMANPNVRFEGWLDDLAINGHYAR